MQNNDIKAPNYWIEHIRKRPGMYIGDLEITGYKQILEYLLTALAEDSFAKPVFEVEFYAENKATLKIIGVDADKFFKRIVELDTENKRISHLGIVVLIALSADIIMTIKMLPTIIILRGKNGNFDYTVSTSLEKENNIIIEFTLDNEIFKPFKAVYEQVGSFLKQFALLNTNVKIISIDKTGDELKRAVFYYPAGIFSEVEDYVAMHPYSKSTMMVKIDADANELFYKICICYTNLPIEKSLIKTYAGNIETFLGGSLNDGIFEGFISAIKALAKKKNVSIAISKKIAARQLVLIAVVKGHGLVFEGSIKRKLGMPRVAKDVRQIVFNHLSAYFQANPNIAGFVLNRFAK